MKKAKRFKVFQALKKTEMKRRRKRNESTQMERKTDE